MAQDILITPKAGIPIVEYTGSGAGAVTITQKVLGTSIMQFDDGGSVLLELDPVANTVSALNLETNLLTVTTVDATTVSATNFYGNGSNLTNVTAEWDGSHTGNATITGNLTLNGTGTLTAVAANIPTLNTGTFDVSGNATIDGTLTMNGNISAAAKTLTIGTVNATTVTGTTITGTTVNAPTLNGGALDVSGNAVLDGTLGVSGAVTLGSTLSVTSTATIGTANVTTLNGGALDVSGNAQVDGNLAVNGTFNVTGVVTAVTVNSTNVSGTSVKGVTVSGTTVTGPTITGTNVSGTTTKGVTVSGTTGTFTTANIATGNITTLNGGALDVSGNAQVDGTLNVNGNVSGAFFYGDGSNLTNIAATAIDHGALAGRSDDDHTQYIINAPLNGTRNVITADDGGPALTIKAPTAGTPLADLTLFVVEASAGGDLFTIDIDGDVSGAGDIIIAGDLKASSKSFLIDHPSADKVGWKLQHTCLEGPENGVYARGRANSLVVDLPHYWPDLVHEETITVHLTPIGLSHPIVRVSDVKDNKIFVEGAGPDDLVDFFYIAYATRKDIPMLVVEHAPEGDA